jgi:hypothetical protein
MPMVCTLSDFAKAFGFGWAAGIATVAIVLVIAALLERK